MPIRGRIASLASLLLILTAEPVLAEWRYLAPGDGDQNVHRAFAFAEESDDRLEFACDSKRRDLFYSTAQTVSEPNLDRLRGGKPTILIRLDGVGVVPLDADRAYQKGGRLIFVTAVTPSLINDLGKARKPVTAGMRASGKIVRQGQFPTDGLQEALKRMAAGCGFNSQASTQTSGSTDRRSSAGSAQGEFARYRNARFGYELTHPSTFVAEDPPHNGAGQSWISADGLFELHSFASFNSDGSTLQSLKQDLVTGDARFRNEPVAAVAGDILWVFSDTRPRAHGYAAIFSCHNQIVNVVEVSFPARSPHRARFDKIAESIITSFRVGVGEDSPRDCATGQEGGSADSRATASSTDHPFSDPSLKRLAIYGWSTAGLQDGLWSSGVNGENGTVFYIKCSTGSGELRNGSIELRGLRHLATLSGNHQVNVEIGDYQHGGVFTFSPGNPGANGMLKVVEDKETAGVYLEFLRALASGKVLTIEVLDTGYREAFNLFLADYALGPCMGRPIAQPWSNHGERDGVYGTSVRNEAGGAFYIRCDATAATRGAAVLAFAAPRSKRTPGVRQGQMETIKAFAGTRFRDVRFVLTPEPNVMTGAIYLAAGTGSDRNLRELLKMLSGGVGTELRLLNSDLGVDTKFSLVGARQSLAACSKLY